MKLEAKVYTPEGSQEKIDRVLRNLVIDQYLKKIDLGVSIPESEVDWDWVTNTAPLEFHDYLYWYWYTEAEGAGAKGFLTIKSPVVLSLDKLGKASSVFNSDDSTLYLEAVVTN
jgi:hypothetical protein